MPNYLSRLRQGSHRRFNNGFTLLELTLALSLTLIAAGGITLSYGAYERRALYDMSRTLQADLRYIQRMAVLEGRRWGILFDRANRQYHIYSTEPQKTERTVTLSYGVSLKDMSYPYEEYLPRGTSQRGTTITLLKGRYQQKLTVVPSGGRVEIKEITKTN